MSFSLSLKEKLPSVFLPLWCRAMVSLSMDHQEHHILILIAMTELIQAMHIQSTPHSTLTLVHWYQTLPECQGKFFNGYKWHLSFFTWRTTPPNSAVLPHWMRFLVETALSPSREGRSAPSFNAETNVMYVTIFFWSEWFSTLNNPVREKGFSGGTPKNLPANAGDLGLVPGLGWPPGGGNSNPPQCFGLENSMDREAWWATAHGVTKSWIRLRDWELSTEWGK